MTRADRDPQLFARESLEARRARAGRFHHFTKVTDPAGLRDRLEGLAPVRLVAWLEDLDGDLWALYEESVGGAMLCVREWRCGDDCEEVHGALDVSAASHGALVGAVAAALALEA